MKSRVVLGGGDALDVAWRAWSAGTDSGDVMRLEIAQHSDYSFDLSVFDRLDPAATALFIAFDERFGNFKRLELMHAAMERGFRLESIVSAHAMVGGDARIGPNTFVGDGAVIGAGALIDYNCVLHAGAIVGYAARVRASCWIESGVILGARTDIGMHSILRTGASVANGVKVGRGCELAVARAYREEIAPKTVFDPRFDTPIRVYGG